MLIYNPLDGFWYADTPSEMPETSWPASVKVISTHEILTLAESGEWKLESRWDGILNTGTKNLRDSIIRDSTIRPTAGATVVVYENNQVQLDSSWGEPLDTGVNLIDGATYEIIISAMEGISGSSSSQSNELFLVVLNDDGSIFGYPTNALSMTVLNNGYFTFRYQERAVVSDSSKKSIYLNRLSATIFGSINYGTVASTDIDLIGTSSIGTPVGATAFNSRQLVDIDNMLRIGVHVNGTPTVNIRYLVKVIERISTSSFN